MIDGTVKEIVQLISEDNKSTIKARLGEKSGRNLNVFYK
jgi:hypothetical protein